jgi:cytochrome c551
MVLVLLVLALAAAGCGSGTSTTTGAGGTVPPSSTQTSAGAASSTTSAAGVSSSVTSAASGIDAKGLFASNCSACHGQNGQGGRGPSLQSETDQAKVQNQIHNGGQIMPPFAGTLSDSQITALTQFVLALKK